MLEIKISLKSGTQTQDRVSRLPRGTQDQIRRTTHMGRPKRITRRTTETHRINNFIQAGNTQRRSI